METHSNRVETAASQTVIVQDLHEPLEPGVEFMPLTFDIFLSEETKVPLSKPQII